MMSDMKVMREKVKSLSVLVIDDEEKVLESSLVFMHKFFDHVDGAGDAEIALDMYAQKGGYDVIVSDIRMPRMSGWELIKSLRATEDGLFIAAVTGSPELGTEDLIRTCDIFMKKPVSIEDMVEMMRKIIEKRAL